MKRRSILFFSALIVLFLIASCGSSDKREIEKLLSTRKEAFETKNVELYLSCISPRYKQEKDGSSIGIEEIKRNFLSNVSVFDQIKISYSDMSVYRRGKKADVVQKTTVEVRMENDRSRFQINEKLELEKIEGKWKIVKESNADFLTGFVFGGRI